jgi:hypothetical protein
VIASIKEIALFVHPVVMSSDVMEKFQRQGISISKILYPYQEGWHDLSMHCKDMTDLEVIFGPKSD